MLNILVLLCILACAGFMLQEGVFSATVILFCVVLGGLIAFNFYEPFSSLLGTYATFLGRYADYVALMTLFSVSVTALRLGTEFFAPMMVQLPDLVHRGGGIVAGAVMGWILAGILICSLQMLPLHKKFMGYDYRFKDQKSNGFNADRYWLAFVQRSSVRVFEQTPPRPFDPRSSFVIRYNGLRYSDAGFEAATGGGDAVESLAPTTRSRRGRTN